MRTCFRCFSQQVITFLLAEKFQLLSCGKIVKSNLTSTSNGTELEKRGKSGDADNRPQADLFNECDGNNDSEHHGVTGTDSKYNAGQIHPKNDTSKLQQPYGAYERSNKKLLLSDTSTKNKNKGSSFLGLPIQLQEDPKDASLRSKPSNIPTLVKKEGSPKRKLSSLLSSSKSIVDGKDKAVKKEHKRDKSNGSKNSLEENAKIKKTLNRKGSVKQDAYDKKKKPPNNKGESIKISPITALTNQCRNGFGKRKGKVKDKNNDNFNDGNFKSDKSCDDKNGPGKIHKPVVKKSYSMDSMDDICKTLPGNEQGLQKDKNQELHYSQSQIDSQNSFFEKHPHAVLKATKTKDGYTVYGSGKKWTLTSGKKYILVYSIMLKSEDILLNKAV